MTANLYLFASVFVSIFGAKFPRVEHEKVLKSYPLIEDHAPTVGIYLPVRKEPLETLENTWRNIAALQYPTGRRAVFVLDDGADDCVKLLAQRFDFNYICRPDRPMLKKAGNIRYAFTQTSGEFFAVFDADFCPRYDFLLEAIPYHIADPKRAIVQTPQFFRSSSEKTWAEQGAGASLEFIYRVLQTCRDTWGPSTCVGTNAIYRRAALEPVGGCVPVEASEDIVTGFWAATHGWTVKYIPLVLCCGACPDTPRAYFSQQVRWCTGTVDLVGSRKFWTSTLSVKQKMCYLISFSYYITLAFQPFLSTLPGPLVLWMRPDKFRYYNMFFAFPAPFLQLFVYRIWTLDRYTLAVQYATTVESFASLQSIWDIVTKQKLNWAPSGDVKAHKNNRYRNMCILAWAWTITHESLMIAACVYSVFKGQPCYSLVPLFVVDGYNLLCIHRFLLYRHPKS